jgi:GDP-L-fucose synthase
MFIDFDKTFLVTGGAGFLGRFVVRELQKKGAREIIVPRSREYDLTQEQQVEKLFEDTGNIDVIIHLAASVGGIGFNKRYPADVFYKNIMMNTLVMEYARRYQAEKFVGIGSVCGYPKYTPVPFKEDDLWNGYPEETNASYGLAKKMMLAQGQSYHEQYGFNAIHLIMINLYGPGDKFDLEYSHVIPAIIRKFVDAKEQKKDKVITWGTGQATREFLYVDDAAEGIVIATERYNKPEPVNLGAGQEIKVKDLVYLVKDLVGFEGEVVWDTSKPDGQPRRRLDTSRAKQEFNFEAQVQLKEGLRRTLAWYNKRKDAFASL